MATIATPSVSLPVATAEPTTAPRALTTRFADFWLLGGASLLVWLAMFAAQGFRGAWAVDQHFRNLTYTTASLSLLVNYPHFLISYKLAYSRGRAFVATHWWQLLAVPALMLVTFAAAYRWFDLPVREVPGVGAAAAALGAWGENGRVLSGPRLGDLLFTAAFNVMILTVGWHYTKQVFGCMMVYAHYDGYAFTPGQRRLTKYALMTIWAMNFTQANLRGSQNNFSQFTYYSFDLPDVLGPAVNLLVLGGLLAVLYAVFWTNYRGSGRLPGVNMLVPFISIYVWWLPQTRQSEFYFLLTPLFHSLQYLTFVYRMEDGRLRSTRRPELRATLLVAGTVAAGWLAFELVPNTLDNALGTFSAWRMFFFFTAAMLFINIHHYFIDNVLWRFRDPRVRGYLLS